MTDRELATFAFTFALLGFSLLLCHLPPVKRIGAGLGLIVVAVIDLCLIAISFFVAWLLA